MGGGFGKMRFVHNADSVLGTRVKNFFWGGVVIGSNQLVYIFV
jgi:hypothetical protein